MRGRPGAGAVPVPIGTRPGLRPPPPRSLMMLENRTRLLLIVSQDVLDQARVIAGRATTALKLRSEEHTSELQSLAYLVCRLLLEKKKKIKMNMNCFPLSRGMLCRSDDRDRGAVTRPATWLPCALARRIAAAVANVHHARRHQLCFY